MFAAVERASEVGSVASSVPARRKRTVFADARFGLREPRYLYDSSQTVHTWLHSLEGSRGISSCGCLHRRVAYLEKLDDRLALNVLSTSDRLRSKAGDPEKCEYFVRVAWLDTVPESKAFADVGRTVAYDALKVEGGEFSQLLCRREDKTVGLLGF